MKLLRRRRGIPRLKTTSIRPAEPYLAAGAGEARRLGHNYIGTEHVLSVLVSERQGTAARLLAGLGVGADAVEAALDCWLVDATTAARIDPQALAELGIDFDAVRDRLEQTFGPGALERTRSGCLGICPRLKMALAYAVDHASGRPLGDEDVLLGMLSVPDSVAARVLASLGVTQETLRAELDARA